MEKICDFCGEPIAGGLQEHALADCAHYLRDKVAQLEGENEQLRKAGRRLLSVLPDSVAHENTDNWEWCWNELDGQSQDEVKEARNLWYQALGGE